MTAPIPITIPNVVKLERNLFRRKAVAAARSAEGNIADPVLLCTREFIGRVSTVSPDFGASSAEESVAASALSIGFDDAGAGKWRLGKEALSLSIKPSLMRIVRCAKEA